MRYFFKVSVIFVFIFSVSLFASCKYEYEDTESSIEITTKTITDYAGKVNTVVSVPGYYGSWSTANRFWRERKSAKGWNTFDLPNSSNLVGGVTIPLSRNAGSLSATKVWSSYYGGYIDFTVSFSSRSGGRGSDMYFSTSIRRYYPATTKIVVECPNGYSEVSNPTGGAACKKEISYSFEEYTCEENSLNPQGFSWELNSPIENDGSKIDGELTVVNNLTTTIYSHSVQPICKRKYQECSIDCESPLVLEPSSGKCVIAYEDMCIEKGMIYNSSTHQCEKENQCGNTEAYEDSNTSYCAMMPNCQSTEEGCGETVNRTCNNAEFTYSTLSDVCEKDTSCLENEHVLSDGTCGSTPFCNADDTEALDNCIRTVNLTKSCAPDSRNGNQCFVSSGDNIGNKSIDYFRPLAKNNVSGSFKEEGYGNNLPILCTDSSTKCEYRLVKMYAEDDGKSICFEDAQGINSCLAIKGDCTVSGSIDYLNGIKQLKVEDGNKIIAYNIQEQKSSIGSIHSTCTLSGKVGNIEGIYISSDITSVLADEQDIKFWDEYKRGFIGVISILPSVPKEDQDDGFNYQDKEVHSLFNEGFTGFYSENNSSVYGVYNGLISKSNCQSLIDGTTFYIAMAETEEEDNILKGLSFKSGSAYNYSDGDLENGSCVIKSDSSNSFSNQDYSIKSTAVNNLSTIFVCSPLACSDHYCQYNQCPTNYSPTLYDQTYFDTIISLDFPDAIAEEVCVTESCDSNKPYFEYCGNGYGCETKENVYQQSDGSCVEVTCESGKEFDIDSGKCISFGCKNSIERDGKCYKSLY
ncbi:hypothetical protein [Sulfurimonas sp.]|uniref:hypothetical protein n=1 Tax=Sulfurimonas sp. TaxID=2022749 RepID=UPI0025DEB4D5|nr:hypothetical protein [Sulfurimonas sp.]